eukprot:ANDGO_01510.mRNA.1 hypothetical protein
MKASMESLFIEYLKENGYSQTLKVFLLECKKISAADKENLQTENRKASKREASNALMNPLQDRTNAPQVAESAEKHEKPVEKKPAQNQPGEKPPVAVPMEPLNAKYTPIPSSTFSSVALQKTWTAHNHHHHSRKKQLEAMRLSSLRVTTRCRGHSDFAAYMQFSSENKVLFTASWDNTFRFWNLTESLESGAETSRPAIIRGPSDLVTAQWMETSNQIAAIAMPSSFLMFDATQKQLIYSVQGNRELKCMADVNRAASRVFALGTERGRVALVDPRSRTLSSVLVDDSKHDISSVQWISENELLVCTGSQMLTTDIRSFSQLEEPSVALLARKEIDNATPLSSALAISMSTIGGPSLLSLVSGDIVMEYTGFENPFLADSAFPCVPRSFANGSYLAIPGHSGLCIYGTTSPAPVAMIGTSWCNPAAEKSMLSVAASQDGSLFAVSDEDGEVLVISDNIHGAGLFEKREQKRADFVHRTTMMDS